MENLSPAWASMGQAQAYSLCSKGFFSGYVFLSSPAMEGSWGNYPSFSTLQGALLLCHRIQPATSDLSWATMSHKVAFTLLPKRKLTPPSQGSILKGGKKAPTLRFHQII